MWRERVETNNDNSISKGDSITMRKTKLLTIVASFAVAGAAMGLLLRGGAKAQEAPPQLTLSDGGEHNVHVFPTVSGAAALAELSPDPGPLLYHSGGVVMTGSVTT